jgi:hypothetical protein
LVSIGKRAACIAAAVGIIAMAGPVAHAGAAPMPTGGPAPQFMPAGPISGAYQAGADAAIGGWNAGADAAIGGFNAGAAALGMPFQFTLNTGGPYGLHTGGLAPLAARPAQP